MPNDRRQGEGDEARDEHVTAQQVHGLGNVGERYIRLAEGIFEDSAKGEVEDRGPDKENQDEREKKLGEDPTGHGQPMGGSTVASRAR